MARLILPRQGASPRYHGPLDAQFDDGTTPVPSLRRINLAALEREYAEMARDEEAEAEAIEWIEALIADIPDEPW